MSPTFNFSNDSCIISFVFRKDVRLPQQLQRPMAAEAEATSDARAKVGLVTSNWFSIKQWDYTLWCIISRVFFKFWNIVFLFYLWVKGEIVASSKLILTIISGHCCWRWDECLSCTEGSCWHHFRVSFCSPAAIPPNTDIYLSWEKFHYHLPSSCRFP